MIDNNFLIKDLENDRFVYPFEELESYEVKTFIRETIEMILALEKYTDNYFYYIKNN